MMVLVQVVVAAADVLANAEVAQEVVGATV